MSFFEWIVILSWAVAILYIIGFIAVHFTVVKECRNPLEKLGCFLAVLTLLLPILYFISSHYDTDKLLQPKASVPFSDPNSQTMPPKIRTRPIV